MAELRQLDLQGFKSIRKLEGLSLHRMNVLIGANGSGKSNLISFFRLLSWMVTSPGELQSYVAKSGGANALLYEGAEETTHIGATLVFDTPWGPVEYGMNLEHAAPDALYFREEKRRAPGRVNPSDSQWKPLGIGHRETKLLEQAADDNASKAVLDSMRRCAVYHFHNTSETARIRQKWDMEDNLRLKEDGANLGPFLWRIRMSHYKHYRRIAEAIRQIAPFFGDFELEPAEHTLSLRWRVQKRLDVVFGPHQTSDGTLRVMALIALLLQPEESLPDVIILDEPELGLHPYAINVIAGLLKSVSLHTQVILATQSVTLLDYFQPDDVIVVDWVDRTSTFRRLDPGKLKEWLEEYSLGELWEKNVIGGRPA